MKSLVCFVLFLIPALSHLHAQFGYPKTVTHSSQQSLHMRVFTVDVDNDGYKDVVTPVTNELVIHLNKGNVFKSNDRTRSVYYPAGSSSVMDFRDLDSDNLPDLIGTYNNSSGKCGFYLFKNLGDGNFGFPDTLSIQGTESITYGRGLKLFDITGDGFTDIIYASSKSIKIFAGTADPMVFQNAETVYSTTNYIGDFEIKDLNNDGSFDIVFRTFTNAYDIFYLNVLKHTGNNYVFANLFTSEFSEELVNFRYGDVNNDGLEDIVFQNNVPELIVGTNTGNFNFTYQASAFQTPVSTSFELFDLNEDNFLDVVLATDRNLTYFPNNLGTFSSSIPASVGFTTPYTVLRCTDFDNDGKGDFLFLNTTGGTYLRLTLNNGGAFGYTTMLSQYLNETDLSCIDFDHDGMKDLVFTNGWLSNEGNGKFGAINFFSNSAYTPIYLSAIGDLDLDGDYDLVARSEDSLFAYMNQGNDYDFSRNFISLSSGIRALELFDLNKDGKLDLFYQSYVGETKFICRLNTPNGWGNELEIPVTYPFPWAEDFKFKFADFDGDSKPELMIPGPEYIKLYPYNGNGFEEITRYVSGLNYIDYNSNYFISDVNLDGHQDIVLKGDNSTDTYIGAALNDGNMNFHFHPLTNPISYPNSIYLFPFHLDDFDSDNDFDLVAAYDNYDFWYHENRYNSIDITTGEAITAVGDGVHKITSANLFGSESPELIVRKNGRTVVYENLSIPGIQLPSTGHAYPNPAQNQVTFGVPFNQFQAYTIEIFSPFGTHELSGVIDYENQYLDISNLSAGLHLVKIIHTQTGEVIHSNFIKI